MGSTSLVGLWQTMSWFPRCIVFILVIMAICVIAVTIAKLIRFIKMANSTRRFAPAFSSNLKEGNITDAINLAKQYETKSHVAQVLGVALREVKSQLPLFTVKRNDEDIDENLDENSGNNENPDESNYKLQLKMDEPMSDEAIETAERAVEREQVLLASNMKSGLTVMATVGATAPFVGLLGTTLGVINAFTGMAQAGGGIAAISAGIAEALITTAVGLLVAIPSVWLYNYFNSRLNTLFSELTYAGREMVDWMLGNGTFNLEHEAALADFKEDEPNDIEVEGLNLSEGSEGTRK